jgi:hypothetical protein
MDRQLLQTITASQPCGDSAGDWLLKVSMAIKDNVRQLPAQSIGIRQAYATTCILLCGRTQLQAKSLRGAGRWLLSMHVEAACLRGSYHSSNICEGGKKCGASASPRPALACLRHANACIANSPGCLGQQLCADQTQFRSDRLSIVLTGPQCYLGHLQQTIAWL